MSDLFGIPEDWFSCAAAHLYCNPVVTGWIWNIHSRVPMCQGKVREKWNFAKVREMSGNFDECQGNLKNKAKVREMSGNFEQTVREFSSIGI